MSGCGKQAGFTLVELLVTTVIASLMMVAIVSSFLSQTAAMNHEALRDQMSQEARMGYEVIARLLRQARQASIGIDNGAANVFSVDFELPAGYAIWPNNVAPYNRNFVRLRWTSDVNGNLPMAISIANATSGPGLNGAAAETLLGSNADKLVGIIGFEVWPLAADGVTKQAAATDPPDGGYRLELIARAGSADPGYTNPDYVGTELENFRTFSVGGVVTPRN